VLGLVLGRVISTLREKKGWSQGTLAEQVGVSQSVISRIESGRVRPDIYLYGLLAETCGMTVERLNEHVRDAQNRTRKAAEAAMQTAPTTPGQTWQEAIAIASMAGLVGLIGFAVAAALSDEIADRGQVTPPVTSKGRLDHG